MKELLRNWIESYDKDSKVYRVLIGKSGNILKLMKEVKQKTLEEVFKLWEEAIKTEYPIMIFQSLLGNKLVEANK